MDVIAPRRPVARAGLARFLAGIALPLSFACPALAQAPAVGQPAAIVQPPLLAQRPSSGQTPTPPLTPAPGLTPSPGGSPFPNQLRLGLGLSGSSTGQPSGGLPATPAAPAAPAARAAAPQTDPSAKLTLEQCVALALERQPAVAAARASLASTEAQHQALLNLRIPTCLAVGRELLVRRQQSCVGLEIAREAVRQAELETVYSVKRSYYTLQYARMQVRVVRSVVNVLAVAQGVAEQLLPASRTITQYDIDRTSAFLSLAESKQLEATTGVERALAALREAVGVCPEEPLDVADDPLPVHRVSVTRDQVVGLALSRRPELVQANVFTEVVGYEVEGQATASGYRVQTFAAAGDVHSRTMPAPGFGQTYMPGAVPPEMPVVIAGKREDRVARAKTLHARAAASADKARNLIVLEATDAYIRWTEAKESYGKIAAAAARSIKSAEEVELSFNSDPKRANAYREYIDAVVLAGQVRASGNEAHFRLAVAVADLERVTAGGVVDAAEASPQSPQSAPKKGP